MTSATESTIDFSADFGGRDAARIVLPYFNALKSSAKGIVLAGFPYHQLVFILRVDGDVHQFGSPGPGNPDIDYSKRRYLSIDIVIDEKGRGCLEEVITASILNSLSIIQSAIKKNGIVNFEAEQLTDPLRELCQRFSKLPK